MNDIVEMSELFLIHDKPLLPAKESANYIATPIHVLCFMSIMRFNFSKEHLASNPLVYCT